ncbi:protein kinase [Streptomyces sp. NBC_00249]|uniref:serine/threonine-protein kinase n=1 Tax=Streptomyces sp. NBC_00249 TaxID=2975690 RepID=UPI00224ED371|nr:serine/threonine-protein kinase [Streptomyces sp. NBC_00249]MCX5198701.1 protein kinase [Streptomyces sp. NBC_00249]
MSSTTEVYQPLRADDPQTVAGYRLVARLGAGGMGRVYLSHTQGGRPVAIKVVRPELAEDPAFRRRFRREVEAARRVRGAWTAELIDAEADGMPPWLATLYVPGPSLSEAVARRGPLPVPAVLWLMAGVAEALQAIHGAGIVHRDLKPSNVLLASDGPRVIDFGISLASDTSIGTATGGAMGTPQYMSPEQASAGEVTAASDVFALGQTAAFAALGEPLYGTGPSMSVLFRIVHSAPDLSRLPEPLRPLLARCLAADPEERATPAEIVAACRRLLGKDADAGGGPAVWREVTGPELTVPAPAPQPTSVHTRPMGWQAPPPAPEEPPARKRRTALVAGVTAGALLVSGVTWAVVETTDWINSQELSTPKASASAPASSGKKPGPSASAPGTPKTSPKTSPKPSAPPTAVPYPLVRLDEKTSIGLRDPVNRDDRTGDIRLDCDKRSCELASDASTFGLLFPELGNGGLDMCRIRTDSDTAQHTLPLAATAAGSRICVKHPSGDIALLVIQVKSVVRLQGLPDWITAEMTVWRAS